MDWFAPYMVIAAVLGVVFGQVLLAFLSAALWEMLVGFLAVLALFACLLCLAPRPRPTEPVYHLRSREVARAN